MKDELAKVFFLYFALHTTMSVWNFVLATFGSALLHILYIHVTLFWNLCPQSAQHPLLSITNGEVCLW